MSDDIFNRESIIKDLKESECYTKSEAGPTTYMQTMSIYALTRALMYIGDQIATLAAAIKGPQVYEATVRPFKDDK